MRNIPDFEIEKLCNVKFVAGCDEVGRGPLCGPVVAAAVIFRRYNFDNMPLILDSKQMTSRQRIIAYDWLIHNSDIVWGIGQCSAKEIDKFNILNASLIAMKRAIDNLSIKPEYCLIDGNKMPENIIGKSIIKGDSKSISIAAASIIAKQTRDVIMEDLSKLYPQYGWNKNVGYPTKEHLLALDKYGINEHYRQTYRPVKERMKNDTN